MAFVRFNTRLGKAKPVTIRALLDSGASESLVLEKHTDKLRVKELKTKGTVWSTPAGELHTHSKTKAQFTIPELQDKKLIEWTFHVTKDMGAYDMIIGRDIMSFLGIDIQFSTQEIVWGHASMPFKPVGADEHTDYHIDESMAVEQSTDRIKEILDAKYEPANLEKVCSAQSQLKAEQQLKLLALLQKYAGLFDGTLGKWTEAPFEIELKEGATPYHARPYPVPRCHADTLRMEVERLVEVGVLKKVNRSE